MERVLNPISDIFIRYLLGTEKNKDLLIDFINAVFEEKGFPLVESLDIKNPFNKSEALQLKESILDVKAYDKAGRIINIEVQIGEEASFEARSVYYWAKNYQSQLSKGQEYEKLEPTVCINLLDYLIFPNLEDFHTCFQITEKDNPQYVLMDHFQIHFIELEKLRGLKEEDLSDKLLAWCYYLQKEGLTEEEDMPVLIKNDQTFQKAHEQYQYFTADDSLMYALEAREKWRKDQASKLSTALKQGLKQGREEGLEEGVKKEAIRSAKKMKEQGISLDVIDAISILSLDEIKAL